MSQAGKYYDGSALNDIETLTGNVGGAVGPDGVLYNVTLTGLANSGIYVTGIPGTNTLNVAMYSPFFGVFEFSQAGAVTTTTDILTLTNRGNNAAMTGTGTGILFNQWYFDGVTPAVADAGRISVVTEGNWTSVVGTQDAALVMQTALDGTLTEHWRISSAGCLSDAGTATDPAVSGIQVRGVAGPGDSIMMWGASGGAGSFTSMRLLKTADTTGHFRYETFLAGGGAAPEVQYANFAGVDYLLAINSSAPTVTTVSDVLRLQNTSNAAGMTGTGSAMLWRQYYFDGVTPAPADAGRISVFTEGNWTSVAGTRDSTMSFQTCLDGTVAEKMKILSNGFVGISVAVPLVRLHVADRVMVTAGNCSTYLDSQGTYGQLSSFNTAGGSFPLALQMDGGSVGIGTTAPYTRLEIWHSGIVKNNYDLFTVTNPANAVDMDGTSTGLLWRQYYYDAVTPAVVASGRIAVVTETDWTSTNTTQDSTMSFQTCLNGTVAEKLSISSKGVTKIGTGTIDATAAAVHTIFNGTAPGGAVTDGIQIYAADTTDTTSTLAIYTEQAVEAGAPTPSHKLKIFVNGTAYWICLDAV